jgi:hypothetical protein
MNETTSRNLAEPRENLAPARVSKGACDLADLAALPKGAARRRSASYSEPAKPEQDYLASREVWNER